MNLDKKRRLPVVPKFEEALQKEKLANTFSQFMNEVKQEVSDIQPQLEITQTKKNPPFLDFDRIDDMFKNLKEEDINSALNQDQNQYATQQKPLQNIKVDEKLKPKIVSYNVKTYEIDPNEEYVPSKPNDYEALLKMRQEKLEEQLKQEQLIIQQELQQLNAIDEEDDYPSFQNLKNQDSMEIEAKLEYSKISTEEKILNMMEKQGWRIGAGLGKNEQGIKTPLIAEKTNSNSAIIRTSEIEMIDIIDENILIKKAATKIVLLLNMIDEADITLQEDVAEECQKFGKDVLVYLMPNQNSMEESVRVFVEFDKIESAIAAYNELHGRIFNGNQVQAFFYNENSFRKGVYYE